MSTQIPEESRTITMSNLQRLYAWACELIYHQLAWGYDPISWLVSVGRWQRWQMAALDHLVGSHILELGFGTGTLMREMERSGYTVYGVDRSPQMQQVAQAKLVQSGLPYRGVLAQGECLPFAAEQFHTIVATFPAAYILAPETLAESVRVLAQSASALPGASGAKSERDVPGRLVIVGAWVSLRSPWLQKMVPLFYGQPDGEALAKVAAHLRTAGLKPTFLTHMDGWANVSVIVAECQPSIPGSEKEPELKMSDVS